MYPTVSLALTVISNSEPVKVSIIMSYCGVHICGRKFIHQIECNAFARMRLNIAINILLINRVCQYNIISIMGPTSS